MNGVTKIVTIPQPQIMAVVDGEKIVQAEVPFVEFAKQVWLNDPRLGQSIELLSARQTINQKLDAANDGVLELWSNEHALLCSIASRPSRAYNPSDGDSILVFYQALINAVEKEESRE